MKAIASRLYGLYTACVYLTPLAGGYLADRHFGQRRMVLFGGAVMAAGHATMASDRLCLSGLFLIAIGNGAFKPNISTQVGRRLSCNARPRPPPLEPAQAYPVIPNSRNR